MPPFKVLIAGGGPVGLTAALALSRANIDFTLFEKHSQVVTTAGSDLVLVPYGIRALSQLGVFDQVHDSSTPLGTIKRLNHLGDSLGNVDFFVYMKEYFGQTSRVIRRYDVSRILYDALPESQRSNVLCNKDVSNIETSENAVKVTCADGSTYTGDMIIGADGVHSAVREHIQKLAADDTGDIAKPPFLTTYQCLWVRFPAPADEDRAGQVFETHGPGIATQIFFSTEHAVAGIYERLEQPTQDRLRLGREDQEALLQRWGHLPLTDDGKYTLRSVAENCISSGMVALEEGVVDRWSYGGRAVLVGDAAHKFTPITGAGCNNGIIDVAVLVSGLQRLVSGREDRTSEQLDAVFAAYQEERKKENEAQCNTASTVTANATWQNVFRRFLDQYIVPMKWLQRSLLYMAARRAAKTPSFDFLPASEHVALQDRATEVVVGR